MKIIEPSYEILSCPDDVLERIEQAARTCYKSEHKIGPGSAESLVKRLCDSGHWPMIEFGGDIVVRFISNRGFTHELVRHRLASFAQESTRYCNYSKDKHGSEVTFINPKTVMSYSFPGTVYLEGIDAVFRFTEEWYIKMVASGVPPQIARDILPIGIKAEINIKANLVEWRHIFKMRTSRKAHPRMRELMIPLLLDVQKRIPIVFDDIGKVFP